jgi:hypothetical protein
MELLNSEYSTILLNEYYSQILRDKDKDGITYEQKTLKIRRLIFLDQLKYLSSKNNIFLNNYNSFKLKKNCDNGKLIWFSDSCWMDSVLYIILAIPNTFIIRNFLYKNLNSPDYKPPKCSRLEYVEKEKANRRVEYDEPETMRKYAKEIQENIISIVDNIQEGEHMKCIKFRNILTQKECKIYEFYDLTEKSTGIASNFVKGLFKLFNIENRIIPLVINDTMYLSNKLLSEKIEYNDYICFEITMYSMDKPEDINLYPDEYIFINNKKMILFGIVLDARGHFVSLLLCDNIWYYYNDLTYKELELIGNYSNIYERTYYNNRASVRKDSLLLFYCKESYLPFI